MREDSMRVMLYLAERMTKDPGLRRKLRALREADPPEAWTALYTAPGAEELPDELLRAMGLLSGHYEHVPGRHPAELLASRGPGGERRLHELLRSKTPLDLAWELIRLSKYLDGELDYGLLEEALRAWGRLEKIRWIRKFSAHKEKTNEDY